MMHKEQRGIPLHALEADDISATDVTTYIPDRESKVDVEQIDDIPKPPSTEGLEISYEEDRAHEAVVAQRVDTLRTEPKQFGTFLSKLLDRSYGKFAAALALVGVLGAPERTQVQHVDQQTTAESSGERTAGYTGYNETIVHEIESVLYPTEMRQQVDAPSDRGYAEQYRIESEQHIPDVGAAYETLAQLLAQSEGTISVTITGYASPEGDFDKNAELGFETGEAAAQAFVAEMVAHGLSDAELDRIDISFGEGGERYQIGDTRFDSEEEFNQALMDQIGATTEGELLRVIRAYNDGHEMDPSTKKILDLALGENRLATFDFSTTIEKGVPASTVVEHVVQVPFSGEVPIATTDQDSTPNLPERPNTTPYLARKKVIRNEQRAKNEVPTSADPQSSEGPPPNDPFETYPQEDIPIGSSPKEDTPIGSSPIDRGIGTIGKTPELDTNWEFTLPDGDDSPSYMQVRHPEGSVKRPVAEKDPRDTAKVADTEPIKPGGDSMEVPPQESMEVPDTVAVLSDPETPDADPDTTGGEPPLPPPEPPVDEPYTFSGQTSPKLQRTRANRRVGTNKTKFVGDGTRGPEQANRHRSNPNISPRRLDEGDELYPKDMAPTTKTVGRKVRHHTKGERNKTAEVRRRQRKQGAERERKKTMSDAYKGSFDTDTEQALYAGIHLSARELKQRRMSGEDLSDESDVQAAE